MRVELAGLTIADPPQRWRALGFAVDPEGRSTIGGVTLAFDAFDASDSSAGHGITGWTLRRGPGEPSPATTEHPNGALTVDHVVIATSDFDATAERLAGKDMALRRVRQAGDRRQGFRRLGPTVMELVEAPEAEREEFWGLTITVSDLTALARDHEHVGEPRPAVQPGRHIAVVHAAAGLRTRLAFMDPE